MIEERIDELIQVYKRYIEQNKRIIESIQQYARDIDCYEIFIESLEYAKTGEKK